MDFLTSAREAVSICTRAFNAHEMLPERVAVRGRMLDTGHFLRGLMDSSIAGEIGTHAFLRDCEDRQPWQLGPQARQLAEAATAKGLLAPAPAPAIVDPLALFRASSAFAPAAGPALPYKRPELVTVEPLKPDAATVARRSVQATAEAAADAEAIRLHEESTGRRSFARPAQVEAPAPSRMFDRNALREQTSGEPAKVAEAPAGHERRAEA